jgi:thiamine-phosphate pyrophosphorylase
MNPDTLRLIDANANRAREGIRTAEDYVRFELGAAQQAGALKKLRASITTCMQRHFSDRDLLASRNSVSDPGRPITSDKASASELPLAVAHRGLKRGQEALRVLEEYLRAEFPNTSTEISGIRFTLYDMEQWLISNAKSLKTLKDARVYVLVTERFCRLGFYETVKSVLKGGCKLIQLREKEQPDSVLLNKALHLHTMCQEHNAVLICNDRVDLALAASAAGVHLGQDDMPPAQIRKIAGGRLLIGRSTHSVEQAVQAVENEGVDYIGIGSIYDTSTKSAPKVGGLALAEKIAGLSLAVPVFAIGGIKEDCIGELRAAGIQRVAVSTAVIASPDPEGATRRMIESVA